MKTDKQSPGLLEVALRAILREVEGSRRPYSAESYLPEHLIALARAALILEEFDT